ncbi:MAG: hypothetical protein Q7R79_03100 [bacterium]|nr:hypothetical protein [bacterium]
MPPSIALARNNWLRERMKEMKTFLVAAILATLATPALAAPVSLTTAVTPSMNFPLDGRAVTYGTSLVLAASTPVNDQWRVGAETGVYASLNKLGEFRPRLSVSGRYAVNKDVGVSLVLGGNTNLAMTSQTYSLLLAPAYKLNKNLALSCAVGPSLSMVGAKYVGVGAVLAPRLTYVF